ncbi:WGR domain-containing protein [Rhizorhapis suberifaciens]|uniref:WGR domain-containing protein n=1 Tax=Rhizorhapis suberifaciens TaxID=13656 RepID=UPI00161BD997|nr:WGR domain-containing protein [Rhizorhapis suberifaciens]
MITNLPTQLRDWRCDLRAINETQNVARAYRVSVTHDLFGHWIVELSWGRVGTSGTGLSLSFESDGAARRFVERTLVRRASAPKRIGVPYRPA